MTQTFRLTGRATVFRAVKFYTMLGDVPCVKGVTLDGKYQTDARIADVVFTQQPDQIGILQCWIAMAKKLPVWQSLGVRHFSLTDHRSYVFWLMRATARRTGV